MTDVQKLIELPELVERLNYIADEHDRFTHTNGRILYKSEIDEIRQAASLLSSQSEEVERLREALRSLLDNLAEGDFISETRIDAAREALGDV